MNEFRQRGPGITSRSNCRKKPQNAQELAFVFFAPFCGNFSWRLCVSAV